MIKGVFFDVGGTLFSYRNIPHTIGNIIEAWEQRLECGLSSQDLAQHYQAANREVDRQFADKRAYLFRDYFKAIFINFVDRIGSAHLHKHFDWFEELQRAQLLDCLELQEDCQATLDQLKAQNLYLSAVSNADENQLQPLIERAQLHRWLTHWTSSEAARSCKPDRRIFEVALEKSGLSKDEVLFVGDSLEQDVQGAYAVGMRIALISEFDLPAPMTTGRKTPEPDFRIRRLQELPSIIKKLCMDEGLSAAAQRRNSTGL